MAHCSDGPLFRGLTVPPACCEMHQYYKLIAHCLLHSFQDEHEQRDVLSISAALSKNATIAGTKKPDFLGVIKCIFFQGFKDSLLLFYHMLVHGQSEILYPGPG